MSGLVNRSYSLAALLINGTKQDVTIEKMKSVFDILNIEFSPKIASMFAFSKDKYASIIASAGAAAPAAEAPASAASSAPTKAAAPAPKEEESEGMELDF